MLISDWSSDVCSSDLLPMSGTAERSLPKEATGTWKLSFKASMMIASLTEDSTMTLDKDPLLPQSYHFERGGLGKSKSADERGVGTGGVSTFRTRWYR